MMKRYAAELLGTFFLVLAGTGAITINNVTSGAVTHVGISLVFGLIVMAMIYALGDISGAHLNPAVTLAFWTARRFAGRSVVPYILCQCLGALLASFVLFWLFPVGEFGSTAPNWGMTLPRGSAMQSWVLELLLTLLLMFVILCVSTGSKEKGVMAGVAIGAVIALEALFAGPICGASMNPARSLAPAVVAQHWEHLWIYLTAPVAGAILAVLFSRFVRDGVMGTSEPAE
jgi:aquaporin NIP